MHTTPTHTYADRRTAARRLLADVLDASNAYAWEPHGERQRRAALLAAATVDALATPPEARP